MNDQLRVRWPAIAALLLLGFHAQSASAQVLADVSVRFPGLQNVPQCSKWETPEISIREPGVVKVSIWLKPYVGSVGWGGGQLFVPVLTQEMGSGGWSGWGGQSRFCCGPLTPADRAAYGTAQTGKWIQNGRAVDSPVTGVELYTESLARQDRVPLRMQFGVMPRCYGGMVYGMSSQDQQEIRLRVDFFPDSMPPPSARQGSGESGQAPGCAREVELYTNNNASTVSTGPTQPTRFTLDSAVQVSSILTYHWNDGRGQPPGSISLVHEDGTRYGPWAAAGAPGSGGVPNANWIARPQVILKPGTYTVVDSHAASWARNAQSNNQGIVVIKGCGVR